MQKMRALLVTGIILPLFALTLLTVPVAAQSSVDQACEGVKLIQGQTCDAGAADSRISQIIKNVVNILSIIVGVAAVITIIISGLRFITSQGDASGIASARSALIYALVGLVIVLFAQVIVRFTLNKANRPFCPPGTTQINTPGDCVIQ